MLGCQASSVNGGGYGLLGGRPVLTRSIPVGGKSVESSVVHATEDVEVLIENSMTVCGMWKT